MLLERVSGFLSHTEIAFVQGFSLLLGSALWSGHVSLLEMSEEAGWAQILALEL